MRVLITGGFGFVGGRLAQQMQAAGHEVLLGSRRAALPPVWLPDSQVVMTPWNDAEALARICRDVDFLVHAAGMNAQDCAANPVAALEFNGVATSRLVAATEESRIKRIIYLSTAHVYASPLEGRIDEDTRPGNLHPYATSHVAGENAVLNEHSGAQCGRIVLRLSNIYGSPVDRVVNCWTLLVNDLCRQVVTNGKMVLRSGGHQQRDFIPMNAFLQRFEEEFSKGSENNLNGIFNVGSEMSMSVLEMARRIQKRCQVIFGFEPTLELPPSGAQPEQNPVLEFRTRRLARPEPAVIEPEIDRLLRFCKLAFA
ncbi:MAG: SDR family oxidoreductase [Pseudomonadota bacterium]